AAHRDHLRLAVGRRPARRRRHPLLRPPRRERRPGGEPRQVRGGPDDRRLPAGHRRRRPRPGGAARARRRPHGHRHHPRLLLRDGRCARRRGARRARRQPRLPALPDRRHGRHRRRHRRPRPAHPDGRRLGRPPRRPPLTSLAPPTKGPTMRTTRPVRIAALAAVATLALAACGDSDGGDDPAAEETGDAGGLTTIVIGASPTPHAEILEFVNENLAEEAGFTLEIVEYTDYVQPNVQLAEGELDANFFQHLPYFETEVAEKGYDFAHFEGVHIEPYGVYSESVSSLDELPDGAQVGVPNDPSNQA